jgi:isoleucyl-tRNA synthetase
MHCINLLPVAQVSEMMRKVRTTVRFMLGNTSDFSQKDMVPYEQLQPVSWLTKPNMAR